MQKNQSNHVEIAIVGGGIVGIACAYYLSQKYKKHNILLIDCRDPMSYTTAQSGDNYRDWWPSQTMTAFTSHSIALMQDIARQTNNEIHLKQRGYLLCTRRRHIDDLLTTLNANYDSASEQVRLYQNDRAYHDPFDADWQDSVTGVDILANPALIQQYFPWLSTEIQHAIHIRQAGDFSSQQMGQWMLAKLKQTGLQRLKGQLINVQQNKDYQLEIETEEGVQTIHADIFINAAGPFLGEVAQMLGQNLPINNVFQQKIAFQDKLGAVSREQAFSIDIDNTQLDWTTEERKALEDDDELRWLSKPIDGGIHCRPEGQGNWIKLGWAYNRATSIPKQQQELIQDKRFDHAFPEIVLRGAARLNPNLAPYIDSLPTGLVHYGGYYTLTDENWPLIGPLDHSGAFVAGALSGFGCMSACATGELCADWVNGGKLPEYAQALSLARYEDTKLMAELEGMDTGIL